MVVEKSIKLEPNYDINKFFRPSVAVDILIFTISNDQLEILLVKRKIEPYQNYWAIPGGFVQKNESLDQAAKRELAEETGVRSVYLEQLYSFGEVKRDPRGRVISVAYFALIPPQVAQKVRASTDVKQVKWHAISKLPDLAFDHQQIIDYALQRLRWKLEYTNVVYSLLDKEFTLTDLQRVYEIIFGRPFDKRNFRKKILSLHLVEPTGKKIVRGVHRPAQTYRFIERKFTLMEIS
jgi:8-oxo-dGTP diphosphatase